MNRKGVNYDVGTEMTEWASRPTFEPEIARRELQIIRDDLHCNAVRISGRDIKRLVSAAEIASNLGLEVWLSPLLYDKSATETLAYTVECAAEAEKLRQQNPQLVFVLGCEFTLFMQGLLPGDTLFERMGNPALRETIRTGAHNAPLNAFLTEANAAVRQVFGGAVTYAAVPFEAVEWSLFDFISLDHYRAAHNRETYGSLIKRYAASNKSLVVTEFGCCAYQGAENAGAMGWAIVDTAAPPSRPQLNGDYVRDEGLQARELTDLLTILEAEGVEGAFVFTFVAPALVHTPVPRFDFDLASYALVKSYAGERGVTYPEMPWEPKEAFRAVSDYFASA